MTQPPPPEAAGWSTATGVILALPELAGFTSPWRSTTYAPDAPQLAIERRFPPHVTVLAPFADAGDTAAIERLRRVAAEHPPLQLTFTAAEQFEPDGAVWLVPEPAAEVDALVRAVAAAFPEHPPYEGRHGDPVPHLTVTVTGDRATLLQVRAALVEQGPLTAWAGELGVWRRGADEVWERVAAVPLGGS